MTGPLWIREQDVQLSLADAIPHLRAALRRQAEGHAANMEKTHLPFSGGSMHALGAVFSDAAIAGVKTWAHTKQGATPLEIVWDSETGRLLCVIEAFSMGQLRTAGMSAIATDVLADPYADELALCGTGKQAFMQAAAVSAVRPLRRVRIFGRDEARREAMRARIAERLGVQAIAFASVAEAVREAPIVSLVTRAQTPFLDAAMVAKGAHINAVGAITPERQEFSSSILARCTLIAVDSVSQAQKLAGEFIAAWGPEFDAARLTRLSAVALEHSRPKNADLTLYKSLGIGIADLALAEAIHASARAAGRGLPLAHPEPASPAI